TAQAELACPPAQPGRGEQVELIVARRGAQGKMEEFPTQVLADVFQRSFAALLAAAQKRVDHLKEEILEKLRVLLIRSRRDEQLPGAAGAVLDRVQKVGLARALVAEHGDHLRVRARIVA